MKPFWKLYSFLFFIINVQALSGLLDKHSSVGIYYNTAIVFSNWFIFPYFLNILNVLITCIVAVFIIGYAFDVQGLLSPPPWLFYVRLLSDCMGHAFAWKMVQSGFVQGDIAGLIGLALLLLPVLPSYLIQWQMSFN